ncbi:tetratricopeptide repeat protein [Parvibaculum sp.]|uniref:tetratricopeptide repeat protein n=1 Tax=Parvibaculum sp. TaxID=2024848 RepID=UPI003BADB154
MGWAGFVKPLLFSGLAFVVLGALLLEHYLRTATELRRTAVWAAPMITGLLTLIAGIGINLISGRVQEHIDKQFPAAEELYRNHDVANLVGQTIRVIILSRSKDTPAADRPTIQAIASVAPIGWVDLVTANDPRITDIASDQLIWILESPSRTALDRTVWKPILSEWARQSSTRQLSDATSNDIATALETTFAVSLREALKHDFEYGGRAWAAVQLDLMTHVLSQTARTSKAGGEASSVAASQVYVRLASLDKLVEDVRLETLGQRDLILEQFDAVRISLAKMSAQLDAVLAQGNVIERMMVAMTDPKLSEFERFQLILALREQSLAERSERQPLPPEIQDYIARQMQQASLLDRHRSLVVLGRLAEADAVATQLATVREAQRADEDREFLIARGVRYFEGEDYSAAVQFLESARRLAPKNPDILGILSAALARVRPQTRESREQAILRSKEALDAHLALYGDRPNVTIGWRHLHLAFLNVYWGVDSEAAAQGARAALAVARSLKLPPDNELKANALRILAAVAMVQGKSDEALSLSAQHVAMKLRLFGHRHDAEAALMWGDHASILYSAGQIRDAERMSVRAIRMARRASSGESAVVQEQLYVSGLIKLQKGSWRSGIRRLRQSLSMADRMYLGDHPAKVKVLTALGFATAATSWPWEGYALLIRAEGMELRLSDESAFAAEILLCLGWHQATMAWAANSLVAYSDASALNERAGRAHVTIKALSNSAQLLRVLGFYETSKAMQQYAFTESLRHFGSVHLVTVLSELSLAETSCLTGRVTAADALFADAGMRLGLMADADQAELLWWRINLRCLVVSPEVAGLIP